MTNKIKDFIFSIVFTKNYERLKEQQQQIDFLQSENALLKAEIKNITGEDESSETYFDLSSELFKFYNSIICEDKTPTDCSSITELFNLFLRLRMDSLKDDNKRKAEKIYRSFTGDETTKFEKDNWNTISENLFKQRDNWSVSIKRIKK